MTDTPKRSGGRRARVAQRAAPPTINPAPAGQIGGQYRPLSGPDMQNIYATALRLLAELGMGEVPTRLWDDLIGAGAVDLGRGRIGLPNALVEDIIDKAAKTFPLHGRDPARTIEVGFNRVYFGTGGAAVNTLDLDSGLYRPSTLQDLHDFTRLQDTLDNVAWFTRCCIATDVPEIIDLDVNTAYALIKNTTKPVATAFTVAETVDPIVHLFDITAGGEGKFADRPFVKTHISPVISPMRFGEDAVDVVYKCIEHNIPMSCITAAQAGATAPATMAGFLVIDLRSGAFAGGGGETTLLNAASAQLSNWLGLPSGVAASMTDAKAIDAQYGVEKGMTSLAAALAGGNLIYESSGMTAALLGVSFEAFILDDDMHAMTYRTLRGVEVTEDNLGFDAIVASVLGDGHFLGSDHTLAAMERDYHYPEMADREQPRTWAEAGSLTAWDRANVKAKEVLSSHHPQYLSSDQDKQIRDAFNIL